MISNYGAANSPGIGVFFPLMCRFSTFEVKNLHPVRGTVCDGETGEQALIARTGPEMGGKCIFQLLEGFGKTSVIAEAHGHGNLHDAHVAGKEQGFGLADSFLIEIGMIIHPRFLLKQTAEVGRIHIEGIGNLLEGYRLAHMFVDIIDDSVYDGFAVFLFPVPVFTVQIAVHELQSDGVKQTAQFIQFDRLEKVFGHFQMNGLLGILELLIATEDNENGIRKLVVQDFDHFKSRQDRHIDIDNHDVRMMDSRLMDGGHAVGGLADDGKSLFLPGNEFSQTFQDRSFVIGYHHIQLVGSHIVSGLFRPLSNDRKNGRKSYIFYQRIGKVIFSVKGIFVQNECLRKKVV